jgi:pimeloyl-ACP methyl ester carboxylesterase
VQNRLASARQMLHTWRKAPINTRPLFNAFTTLKPVLQQVLKSGYIFVFLLPRPAGTTLARIGDFQLFRMMAAISEGIPKSGGLSPPSGEEGWNKVASTVGPGLNQFSSGASDDGLKYPLAVMSRAKENLGGYFEKIRYYRENLFFSTWSKSLQSVWELSKLDQSATSLAAVHSPVSGGSATSDSPSRRRSSVGVFDLGPPGTLSAATTVVWGAKDIAVDHAIAIEGIKDYFGMRPSQVVWLDEGGHWTPVEKGTRDVFARVVVWAVEGESRALADVVGSDGRLTVEL